MQTHIDLIIPGLCGPLPELSHFDESKALMNFVSLLAKSTKKSVGCQSYPEQLCSTLGVNFESIPVAELCLLAYGIEKQDYHWMFADPVHMMADVDHIILYDSASLNLIPEESKRLLDALNEHFIQNGLEFVAGDANHWFVRSKNNFNVSTKCLNDVVMQNINQLLPVGDGSALCKQILNESQMLLHANPVNQDRLNKGLLPANSVWLWGEGSLGKKQDSDVSHCYSNDALSKGLSNYLGVKHKDITSFETLLSNIDLSRNNVVIFDDLVSACCYGDISTWLSSFESLYESLIQPFIAYALKNNIDIHCYPCNGFQYIINSKSKYRFWRKSSLVDYFES